MTVVVHTAWPPLQLEARAGSADRGNTQVTAQLQTAVRTWSAAGTTLTVSETSNDITASVTVFGSAIPLSPPMSFDGETEVVSCDPATFTISTSAPTGAIVQTLVFAG